MSLMVLLVELSCMSTRYGQMLSRQELATTSITGELKCERDKLIIALSPSKWRFRRTRI